ncbi:MAG: chromosome partitioning protein ParB [Porticoccaceae bacterium]|nr:chromosome partitioning protein ParB [Porticoccaceae bacterium]
MAWYHKLFNLEEKQNPAQVYLGGTVESSREYTQNYESFYESLEIVNRGVNMIVDDTAEIPAMIVPIEAARGVVTGVKRSKVFQLLNKQANPFQDISAFKRNCITDFLIDGNIFIYYDGAHCYHLPADKVRIETSRETLVEKYLYNDIVYTPDEIIHIKENSFHDIYRGVSRLKPALRTMILMNRMRNFQDKFFENGAVPGLVLKSPNTLSDKIKERMILAWQQRYRPDSGGRRPLILDGGIEVDALTQQNFKDLDFQQSIADNEKIILKALGIPPILLDSGNNANIRPNMRLYYLETILPIVRKMNHAYGRYFGFTIREDVTNTPALQPELRDAAAYYTSLVNAGVITTNEAREKLGYDFIDGQDEIRVPQNIAGSAVNPSQGGRPEEENNDE